MVSFLLAVLPSAGVLFLFWLAIRALVTADRRERTAAARLERDTPPPRAVVPPVQPAVDGADDVTER